jgi:hypothetical protein
MRTRAWLAGSVGAVALGLLAAWLTRTPGARSDATGVVASTPRARLAPSSSPAVAAPRSATVPSVSATAAPQAHEAEGPVERDPRHPRYDAARLFSLRLDGAKEIFTAEPRDEAWARRRESGIVDATLGELKRADPDVRMEVECHTGTCRVRVHSKNPFLIDRMGAYPLQCLASYAQPEWGNSPSVDPTVEDPYSDFYMVFGADVREEAGFTARIGGTCARYRDEWVRDAEKR